MTSALVVYLATFVSVFALGLQSLNVNQGHYIAAAVTSFFIGTGHIFLYCYMPQPGTLDLAGYYIGGITGITASMWFHRSVKAWWAARRARSPLDRISIEENRAMNAPVNESILAKQEFELLPVEANRPVTKTGLAPAVDHEAVRREQEQQARREALERAYRQRLFELAHQKWKGPLRRDDLQLLADILLDVVDDHGVLDSLSDLLIETERMNERELTRLLVMITVCESVKLLGNSPAPLLALAKRLRIDTAKVKKQVERQVDGKPEPKPKSKGPAKKKKSKKAGK